jgi:hypothetical protein
MKCVEEGSKRASCPDCKFCQYCSFDRCRICKGGQGWGKKLSSAEQIELYERLNSQKERS